MSGIPPATFMGEPYAAWAPVLRSSRRRRPETRFIGTVARETIRVAYGIGREIIAAVGCFCLAACSSSSPSQPQATTSSSTTRQPTVTEPLAPNATPHPNATAAPHAITPCVGLSIFPPPPPDAEGNPGCYSRVGWAADPSAWGINFYYFRNSSIAFNPEQVTADVHGIGRFAE